MFMHNKRLQYTVRVSEPNPLLATMMLEQFGGADGELAAAMRYFTQGIGEDDAGRKDLLLDIATEELSHLEVIGSIVAMLNKGVKAQLAEGAMEEVELYRAIGSGSASAKEALLFGGGPALIDSAGVPWTAAYVDSRGEPTAENLDANPIRDGNIAALSALFREGASQQERTVTFAAGSGLVLFGNHPHQAAVDLVRRAADFGTGTVTFTRNRTSANVVRVAGDSSYAHETVAKREIRKLLVDENAVDYPYRDRTRVRILGTNE